MRFHVFKFTLNEILFNPLRTRVREKYEFLAVKNTVMRGIFRERVCLFVCLSVCLSVTLVSHA